MRRREGIEDVELREMVRGLGKGDHVNLRFLTGEKTFETWLVRITSVKGSVFRGKLTSRSADEGRSILAIGATVIFKAAHIHSLARRQR